MFSRRKGGKEREPQEDTGASNDVDLEYAAKTQPRRSMGILNDKLTDEVPGSVLLLSKVAKRNEPLGLRHAPARTSSSSLPSPYGRPRSRSRSTGRASIPEKKRTADGTIILTPQPDDSPNDPLNWPMWRRDLALLSIGYHSMVGGGMTPILAAGFTDVAKTYNVSIPSVALTTGLYMLGLGIGSVIASPTAILYGKRPVYLGAVIIFMLSAIWCALSPTYVSLLIARIVQGLSVSPVECLPSASVAEIYFLHERAYRLGIYTLLLLGGKNLIPLISAAIVQSLGWRWVFWIIAINAGFTFILLFLFVPETFWDRTPEPSRKEHTPKIPRLHLGHLPKRHSYHHHKTRHDTVPTPGPANEGPSSMPTTPLERKREGRELHVEFAPKPAEDNTENANPPEGADYFGSSANADETLQEKPAGNPSQDTSVPDQSTPISQSTAEKGTQSNDEASSTEGDTAINQYTAHYRSQPPKSFKRSLKIYSGRLSDDHWLKVAIRPFILYAYPAVLWSTVVYSLSIGWLIVLSESVAEVYRNRETYNFTALQCGLVYLSPFIGGILGTAVAGKISDYIVRFMARRNDGVYEPEFRLVMALPIAIATTIGLMGFGWSVQEHDKWIVPTVFFGVISFGCSLGSTTSITFCVDSYRQYAGEALVTLNFSKNVFHGFVFSLFFTKWLSKDGPKSVFLAIGGIQLGLLMFSIPMYIYGKRARMWTVRKNLVEKY